MNDKTNDGGQAFPVAISGPGGLTVSGGMSLRDYFAGQALISDSAISWGHNNSIKEEMLYLDSLLRKLVGYLNIKI